jgi:TetR/AcrR family transcriptional repressor of nem operon
VVRQREFDKDKALEAALQVFWEKGYTATSLSDLTTSMNIHRPSLYAAFGDKEKLFELALRKYTAQHADRIRKKLQNKTSVKEAFRLFFQDLIEEEYRKDLKSGCFCINTMVELAPKDEKFEILTREHQMFLSILFEETIAAGIRSGELNSSTDAKSLAQTFVVSLIGLTVLIKSRPERSFLDNAITTILSLLN